MDGVCLLIPVSASLAGEDWTAPVVSTRYFASATKTPAATVSAKRHRERNCLLKVTYSLLYVTKAYMAPTLNKRTNYYIRIPSFHLSIT